MMQEKFITNYLATGEIDKSIILSNYNKKNLSRNTLLKGDYFQVPFARDAPKRSSILSINTSISSYNCPNSNVPTKLSGVDIDNSKGLFVGSNLKLNIYPIEFNNINYIVRFKIKKF